MWPRLILLATTLGHAPSPRAAVVIDTAGMVPTRANRLRTDVSDRLGARLRSHGIGPRRAVEDPILEVRVEAVEQGFRFSWRERRGEVISPQGETICSPCGETELMRALDEAFETVVASWGGSEAAALEHEVPTVTAQTQVLDAKGSTSALGPAGLGLIIAGGSVGLASVPLYFVDGSQLTATGEPRQATTSLQPVAIGGFVVGGAAVLTGGILLATAFGRRRAAAVALGVATRGLSFRF